MGAGLCLNHPRPAGVWGRPGGRASPPPTRSAYLYVHTDIRARSALSLIAAGASPEQVIAFAAADLVSSPSTAEFVRPSFSQDHVNIADTADEVAAATAFDAVATFACDDHVLSCRANKR